MDVVDTIQKAKDIKQRLKRFSENPETTYESLCELRNEIGLSGIEEIVTYGETIRESVIASKQSAACAYVIENSTEIIEAVGFDGYKTLADIAVECAADDKVAINVLKSGPALLPILGADKLRKVNNKDLTELSGHIAVLQKAKISTPAIQKTCELGELIGDYRLSTIIVSKMSKKENIDEALDVCMEMYQQNPKAVKQAMRLFPHFIEKYSDHKLDAFVSMFTLADAIGMKDDIASLITNGNYEEVFNSGYQSGEIAGFDKAYSATKGLVHSCCRSNPCRCDPFR